MGLSELIGSNQADRGREGEERLRGEGRLQVPCQEFGDDFREIGIELAWVERIVRHELDKAPKNG